MNRPERWKVMSIELSESLTGLDVEQGYAGVRAVFFWNGVPLGHQRFTAEQLPISAPQLFNSVAQAVASAAGKRPCCDRSGPISDNDIAKIKIKQTKN